MGGFVGGPVKIDSLADRLGGAVNAAILGKLPGVSRAGYAAFNNDIDSNDFEDVISNGGLYNFLTSADTLEVASADSNDTALGTGARTILINGLTSAFVEQSEIVILNGTSDVQTVNQYLRVNSVVVVTAGTSNANVGIIRLETTTGAILVRCIPVDTTGDGLNKDFDGVYTVPAGKTGLAILATISVSKRAGGSGVKEAVTRLSVRREGGLFIPSGDATTRSDGSGFVPVPITVPLLLPEKSDVKSSAVSLVNNTNVTVSLAILLFDNRIHNIEVS